MNPVTVQLLALVLGPVTVLAALAAAWGDMRTQVKNNRERQDERHNENQAKLDDISDDVKRINGTVQRHKAVLEHHGREIDRLRDER